MKRKKMSDEVEKIISQCPNEAFQYIDVNWLARELGVNVPNLSLNFKRQTGKTLQQYLIEEKMKRAFYLFGRGRDITAAEAAAQLGYNSVSHFIQVFKKINNVSPGNTPQIP